MQKRKEREKDMCSDEGIMESVMQNHFAGSKNRSGLQVSFVRSVLSLGNLRFGHKAVSFEECGETARTRQGEWRSVYQGFSFTVITSEH